MKCKKCGYRFMEHEFNLDYCPSCFKDIYPKLKRPIKNYVKKTFAKNKVEDKLKGMYKQGF